MPVVGGSTGGLPTPTGVHNVLGSHLLRSFLLGSCADLVIWVREWGVGWKVHRMVLIQAGELVCCYKRDNS